MFKNKKKNSILFNKYLLVFSTTVASSSFKYGVQMQNCKK